MAIEDGYTRYCCDRTEKVHKGNVKPAAYLLPNDKARDNWHEVEFVDTLGVPMRYMLCPDCFSAWTDLVKKHTYEQQQFMNDGIKSNNGNGKGNNK